MTDRWESEELAYNDGLETGYDLGCHREWIWTAWSVFVGVAMFCAGFTVGSLW